MGLRLRYGGSYPVEDVTGARPVIDSNHGQIHSKAGYGLYDKFTLSGAGGGASRILRMDVPVDSFVHFQAANIENDGALDVEVTLIEAPTISVAGTLGSAITPRNRHRAGGAAGVNDISVLTFKPYSANPTFSGGLVVDGWHFPKEGTVAQRVAGAKENSIEIVLRPDTVYFWKFTTTQTTGSGTLVFRPFWYEESGY